MSARTGDAVVERGRVTLDAPAKVNLVLRVLERDEATGYHRLETVFQAVALADRLSIEVGRAGAPAVELEVSGADVGPPEENLVTRAARAFLARIGAEARLRIGLEKRIPAGAGLGGGSSDAAAALRALNILFGERLAPSTLHELGAALGSDVPFFLCGSPTALAWGRGDRLRPVSPLPVAPVLLVLPGVHVATADAYEALAKERAGPGFPAEPRAGGLVGREGELDWASLAAEAVNDFEAVVPPTRPRVARALRAVRDTAPRLSLLSGSGSAVFGVYRDTRAAAHAREILESGGHDVVETRTLERVPEPVRTPAGVERAPRRG